MSFTSSFADKDIFAAIMTFFVTISTQGIASMIPYASYLICIFAIIDLCTSWYLYDGQMKFSVMISKIIKIGAFFFLVIHWADITSAISRSFSYIGYIGGGHSPTEAATLVDGPLVKKSIFNPSYIIDLGNAATSNISKAYMSAGSFNFGQIILYGICWCLVLIGFYFIALQVLLTNIEFSIFTCLAIILLPFGCVKYTAFLSQRAISGVFSFGIKLMVVYFLLGIVASLGDTFGSAISTSTNSKDGSVEYSFVLKQALAYITVGYLVWKLPTLVAGMMQGGTPNLGNDITPSAPIAAGAAVLGTTGAAIKNVRAAFEAGGGNSGGSNSGGGSSNAAGAANQATATADSGSSGMLSRTPIFNRNATFGKIAQYKAQWSGKSLGGKSVLAGKMLALAGAQATVDTLKVGRAVGRAVWGQTGVYRSYRGSLDSGVWNSKRTEAKKDEENN